MGTVNVWTVIFFQNRFFFLRLGQPVRPQRAQAYHVMGLEVVFDWHSLFFLDGEVPSIFFADLGV